MSELICPYCDKECEADFELNQEDRVYDHECEHCDKTFVYRLSYVIHYFEDPAPCLNQESDHEWVQDRGWPEEHFIGKQHCKVCDKRREVKS